MIKQFLSYLRHKIPDHHRIRLGYHRAKGLVAYAVYGRRAPRILCVGITGTDGKTSTTMFLGQVLEHAGYRVGLSSGEEVWDGQTKQKNTSKRTTPSPRFLRKLYHRVRRSQCDIFLIETASHGLSQRRVFGIPFSEGIVTNLAPEHLDYYQTMDAYAASKASLLTIIATSKNPHAYIDMSAMRFAAFTAYENYSRVTIMHPKHFPIIEAKQSTLTGMECTIHHQDQQTPVVIPLIGGYHLHNLRFVIALCRGLGVSMQAICAGLEALQPVAGRMERVAYNDDINTNVLIDFAVTPQALENALRSVRPLCSGRVIVVFGCTGGNHDHSKRPIMTAIALQYAQKVIITEDELYGEPFESIVNEMCAKLSDEQKQAITIIADRKQAIHYAIDTMQHGDCILVTGMGNLGSRNTDQGEIARSDREVIQMYRKEKYPQDV